ncbi:LPS translocon maturation chaperone LptM [Nitrincola tapanii]|uniref:Lipopeptide n=1 Tax=Nitrincola tapanii TaxID=1708751 RepID=A0A5A9W0P9_9GAMM|nr:lipoprotein [Nitrincola tapanii]KAA0874350.1 hypothetical protein E1H14_08735 [Nitrincola tapanii]
MIRYIWPLLLLSLVLLAGCGNKGPLYLPQHTEQAQQAE